MRITTIVLTAACALTILISGNTRASSRTEKVTFEIAQFEVSGDLKIPEGDGPHPAIIVVHGSGGGTRKYYRSMRSRFVNTGYAVLIWDKPGFGSSTGKFSDGELMSERAAILMAAIATLKERPDIDPGRIGVWGVSQASYVIPLAIERDADIAFMILVGAGGENSIEQTAYFVGQQIRCAGATAAEAAEADSLAAGVMGAETYEKYMTYGNALLAAYPIVKELDFMAGILPEDRWTRKPPDGEALFDPMSIVANTAIPVLAFYGELDKNVDPVQGAAAYRTALEKAGDEHSKVMVLPGVDHDMVSCKTGCGEERSRRSNWRPDPGYLDVMGDWLAEIAK